MSFYVWRKSKVQRLYELRWASYDSGCVRKCGSDVNEGCRRDCGFLVFVYQSREGELHKLRSAGLCHSSASVIRFTSKGQKRRRPQREGNEGYEGRHGGHGPIRIGPVSTVAEDQNPRSSGQANGRDDERNKHGPTLGRVEFSRRKNGTLKGCSR